MLQPSEIERALTVTAHPDDVDFGSAGTVAVLTDAGVKVTYCLVTNGDAGGHDAAVSRAEMVEIRQREQTAAAAEVGVHDLVFLGRPDGRVIADLDLRRDIARVIRQVRPTVVITQSPERVLDAIVGSHPDHLATGEATLCAVYPDARNPFAFPELMDEGLEAWVAREVWIASGLGATQSITPVDVTAQLDRKFRALLSHVSQHQEPDRIVGFVRERMQQLAATHGLPEGAVAEGFRVVNTG